jgi:hypothetical protein
MGLWVVLVEVVCQEYCVARASDIWDFWKFILGNCWNARQISHNSEDMTKSNDNILFVDVLCSFLNNSRIYPSEVTTFCAEDNLVDIFPKTSLSVLACISGLSQVSFQTHIPSLYHNHQYPLEISEEKGQSVYCTSD